MCALPSIGRPPSAPPPPPPPAPGTDARPLSAVSAASAVTDDSCETAVSAHTGGDPASSRRPSRACWVIGAAGAESEPLRPVSAPPAAPGRHVAPARVEQVEARRRGVFRGGRLLLPPYAAQPLERSHDDAALWAVLRGRVDVATPGACVSCAAGAPFLIEPHTSYTIVAGEAPAELVYAQRLSGAVGPELPHPSDAYPAEVERRRALAEELRAAGDGAGTPPGSGTDQHTVLLAEEQRRYVTRLRDALERAQHKGLLRHEALAWVNEESRREARARAALGAEEVAAREEIGRLALGSLDAAERADLLRVRLEGTILPWCTMGCNYCCVLQHELHRQVCAMAVREIQVLESSCAAAGDALLAAESIERRRLMVAAWGAARQHEVHVQQRDLLLREAEARWLLLYIDEQREDLALRHRAHIGHETARFEVDAWALRGQSAELCRQAELLQLREDALHRAQLDAVEDRETVARERQEAEEERDRALKAKAESDGRVQHLEREHARRHKALQATTRELQDYRARREAEDAEVERQRREEEQARLAAELEELRKAKKKKGGGGKAIPASVVEKEQCDRCGGKTTKKEYASHIDKDCPERPVECRLCGQVARARELDDHLQECPQRDVACDGCSRTYKAVQMAQHTPLCPRICDARQRLPGFRPVLGVEIAEGPTGLRVATVKPDGPLDGLGVQEDDVMVSFDSAPTRTKKDFITALKTRRPGDEIAVSFLPSARAVGPWWEADAASAADGAPAEPVAVTAVLQTTIPLEDYRELVDLIEEDDKMVGVSTERGEFDGDMGALSKATKKRGSAGKAAGKKGGDKAKAAPKAGGKKGKK